MAVHEECDPLNKGQGRGQRLLSGTYPEDDVVAEEQVLVPAADLGVRVSIIVHLPRSGTCGQTGGGKTIRVDAKPPKLLPQEEPR